MTSQKEIFSDIKEKFERAYHLVDDESKTDPATDPFRSHYAAKTILEDLEQSLRKTIETDENFLYKVFLGFACRDLGRIYVFTEEPFTGEKYLKECLDLVEPYKLKKEAIIAYIGASNEMGIVECNRGNHKEALEHLKRSEDIYEQFQYLADSPMSITDLFGPADEIEKEKGPKEMSKIYTLCTYYMAQVLGHLGEVEKSAQYCNLTLRRQLESNDYDPIDWALNAATLSQYYIGPNMYKEARHHLAAATFVISEYETRMVTDDMTSEVKEAIKESYHHRYADIARCWAKYGIALLNASRERLMAEDEAEKITKDLGNKAKISTDYEFKSLQLDAYENKITDKYCLTFEDAKKVFVFIASWLEKAKQYYRAETEASEYARITMDFADLYNCLAFFDEDPSNQSKMYKKRADFYEELLKLLSRVYYLAICRECLFHCGTTYCSMLSIKLDAISDMGYDQSPSNHQIHKVNSLCEKAIAHFQDFITTYKKKDSDDFQSGIDSEEMHTVLYCYFHLGRLFYKIITFDKKKQLFNLNNSLKYYKLFIESGDKYPEAAMHLKTEISVSKEMANLLPKKIEKTLQEAHEEGEI